MIKEGQKLSAVNKKDNIRQLRRYLGLTQAEFISQYLSDADGNPSMSVATLSNLEARGGKRLNEVIGSLSSAFSIDDTMFSLGQESFQEQLTVLLPQSGGSKKVEVASQKKDSVNTLLYRLTLYLADQLLEKKIRRGDKIESERELARIMGVGRFSIREALNVLHVFGMVDIVPGQGTYISSNEKNPFIIPLAWSMFLNGTQVDNVIEVRNVMEIRAAEDAARFMTDAEREALREIQARMERSSMNENFHDALELDVEFHHLIAEGCRNMVIASLLGTIENFMRRISSSGMIETEQLKDILAEHNAICAAIVNRDPIAARDAMTLHMNKAAERYCYR